MTPFEALDVLVGLACVSCREEDEYVIKAKNVLREALNFQSSLACCLGLPSESGKEEICQEIQRFPPWSGKAVSCPNCQASFRLDTEG
jgi:hypothetical protein